MKWITCEHINVDGVSASWLIKASVDPYAVCRDTLAGGDAESPASPLHIRGDARALQAGRSGGGRHVEDRVRRDALCFVPAPQTT